MIQPIHNPVFPVEAELHHIVNDALVDLEEGQLTKNRLRQLFGTYHNTLLVKLLQAPAASNVP